MDVFGSSGTRGTVNESLTPSFVLQVAQAAGTVWSSERVAVARDTRTSGQMLSDAAASGLASVGAAVDRLGIIPTPGAQVYAETESVPLVMITASHNPPEFNGVKLIGDDGVELRVSELERIEEHLLAESFEKVPWDRVGDTRTVDGARTRYREAVLAAVDRERIADADLTVAIDPGHGAGALTSHRFFRDLGCRVVTVNAQPDGHFPGRDPEPVPEQLDALGRLVRSTDADLGIAHDGDADRAVFYDERGAPIDGSSSFAALAAAELSAGDVAVSAVNVSQRLVDVAEDVGARLELTPIGSTNIITRVQQLQEAGEDVPIAGEGNGGVFFPEYRLARDGAYVAARFCELVADRAASELVAPYDDYQFVRLNVDYGDKREREAMLSAAKRWAEEADATLDTTDGYRLDYGDAWVLTRPSGTEPLIRVYAEARERDRAETLAGRMRDALLAAGEPV